MYALRHTSSYGAGNIKASRTALSSLYIVDTGRESFLTSARVYSLERSKHAKPSALETFSLNAIRYLHRTSFAFLAPSLSKPRLSNCRISS